MGDDMIGTGAARAVHYGHGPAVLLLADNPAGARRSAEMVELLGGRSSPPIAPAEWLDRLRTQIAVDAVLVELSADHGPLLDALLDQLEIAARERRFASVICLPAPLLDATAARAWHRDVTVLVEPVRSEVLAALSLAIARGQTRLQDVNSDDPASQLRQLSEDVGRIAQVLARLASEENRPEIGIGPTLIAEVSGGRSEPPIDATMIRAIIRARRLRDQFFPGGLFAEPAWDMMLDLMAARLEQQPVAVSSLCIAAAVPPTTALRWIKMLADSGIFVRVADPHDRRRVFIELSEEAADRMQTLLGIVVRGGAQLA